MLLLLLTNAGHQSCTGRGWRHALSAAGPAGRHLAFSVPRGAPSLEAPACCSSGSTHAASYHVCVCVCVRARTCLFNHNPSQIQLPPTQCSRVWGGGRLHLLPSDSARSWPRFAQMGRTGGKTQAFPLTIQMFPDIVMFVVRRHLGVCLTGVHFLPRCLLSVI